MLQENHLKNTPGLSYLQRGSAIFRFRITSPEDVIILLSDDNWGNVRRLPTEEERSSGRLGHVLPFDYVGAPRSSKWLNISPIQNIWEQMQLTYDYGVDELWSS